MEFCNNVAARGRKLLKRCDAMTLKGDRRRLDTKGGIWILWSNLKDSFTSFTVFVHPRQAKLKLPPISFNQLVPKGAMIFFL